MLRRWLTYLNEVFLPGSRTLASVILVVGIQWLYQSLLGRAPLVLSTDSLFAVVTLVLILLYYRVQDEFKDAETDRRFFPHRPVPSGRVTFTDLRALMWLTFAALFALHAIWRVAVVPFLALFTFAVLMHNWFFLKRHISTNRLLALVTHAPVSLIGNYYALAVYTNRLGEPISVGPAWLTIVWFALPSLAWEIARKTRAPAEEIPGYQTYSAMIGSAGAALLSIVFVVAQCGLAFALPASTTYLVLLLAMSAAYVIWFVRFALRPSIGSKTLKPVAELFSLVSTIGLIADLALGRGMRWLGWP